MASVDWSEKYKTAIEVKAHFRHNEKYERMKIKNPQNPHLDTTQTYRNIAICNRSYSECCRIYDEAVANAEQISHTETYVVKSGKNAGKTMTRTKTGLRKDAVTCMGLETAAPADLPLNQCEEWAKRVHEILCKMFGTENIIDTFGHFDEIHLYKDPVKKAYVWSRFHIHSMVMPRKSDGSFCSRSIATRANIIKLNDMIEEMTQREFGVKYNTGEEPRRKTVEALKAESAAAELEQMEQLLAEVTAQVEAKRDEYNSLTLEMDTKVRDIKKDEEANAKLKKSLDIREKALDDREIDLAVQSAKIQKEAAEEAERIKSEAKNNAEQIIAAANEEAKNIKKEAENAKASAENIRKSLEAREKAANRVDNAVNALKAPVNSNNQKSTRFDGAAAGYFGK